MTADPEHERPAPAQPRISVVMPSYNQADYLAAALDSILDQGYPDLEIIVMDGGSTDGSVDVLTRYADALAHWTSEPDGGQSDALNKAFSRVTGEVVGWLNSDDTYQPGTLAAVAETFADPHVDIAMSSEFGFIDDAGEIYRRKANTFTDFRTLLRYWRTGGMTINQPCVFFRRSLIADFDPVLDTSLHFAMDYDLWLRLARSHPIRVVPGHWANYRFHDTSKSGHGFDAFFAEWLAVSRRYWGPRYSPAWWATWLDHFLYRQQRRARRLLAAARGSEA